MVENPSASASWLRIVGWPWDQAGAEGAHPAEPSKVRARGTSLQPVGPNLLVLRKRSLRCREGKSFAQQGHRASLFFCLVRVIFILGLRFLNTPATGWGVGVEDRGSGLKRTPSESV